MLLLNVLYLGNLYWFFKIQELKTKQKKEKARNLVYSLYCTSFSASFLFLYFFLARLCSIQIKIVCAYSDQICADIDSSTFFFYLCYFTGIIISWLAMHQHNHHRFHSQSLYSYFGAMMMRWWHIKINNQQTNFKENNTSVI